MCDIKQMCLQIGLESVNGLGTLDGDGERVPERRGGRRKTTLAKTFQAITRCHQEMFTLRTSQVWRATVVMTSKVEPCHVEPCRPATGSCNLFCAQLEASVNMIWIRLVLWKIQNGHDSTHRQTDRQSATRILSLSTSLSGDIIKFTCFCLHKW